MKKEKQTKRGCWRVHATHARANKDEMWTAIPHTHPAALAGPVSLGHLEAETDPGPIVPAILLPGEGGSTGWCFSHPMVPAKGKQEALQQWGGWRPDQRTFPPLAD